MRSTTALATAALLAVGALAGPANAAGFPGTLPTPSAPTHVYVVSLTRAPAAAYAGTRPAPGTRFDRTRPAVREYTRHLLRHQNEVLSAIGYPTVLYRYTTALDGFAVRMTPQQAEQARHVQGVASVERSTKQRVDSFEGPTPSGVFSIATRGIWRPEGGPDRAGKGVVVGVVDTGIWPENPSFAGLPQRVAGESPQLPGFHGACAKAQGWNARDCNTKVVSARWFVRGFGARHLAASDYRSPRDGIGHGSHTASVAAGNHGVLVHIQGQGFGRFSGMAPAAAIAVYKACWTGPDPGQDGCTTADTVAAVDRAVSDGVDVLNYSASGADHPSDALSQAFLNAASAGVFVATAAGNSGDRDGDITHTGPWVTTVGASTHREFRGAVVLGNGTRVSGAMVSAHGVPTTGLVLGRDVPAPGSSVRAARFCRIGALDAERTQGKIVVCDRGKTARVDKSTAVADAGGAGMVLVNTAPGSTDADIQEVPSVHLDDVEGRTVKAYLAHLGTRATAALRPLGSTDVSTPKVAGFSSRGPSGADGGSILKPDITAPGVSVLGAVAPPTDGSRLWDLGSGTSTSAPNVAGFAADVLGVHPRWTPAQVKSALMTTAGTLGHGDGPFAGGAGHVDPLRVVDPGLVFGSGPRSWRALLGHRLRARDLNLPSVAVGNLVGRTAVTRRVTSVAHHTETYTAHVAGLRGVAVSVQPDRLTVPPGQTRRLTLRFAVGPSARLDRYALGSLTLEGPRHTVRVPVVARPRAVAVQRRIVGVGHSGKTVVRTRSGTDRPVTVRTSTVVPAAPTGVTLVPGSFDKAAPEADASTFAAPVTVPAGAELARFQLDSHNDGDDVNLYVYRDGTLVGSDTSAAADARVTLTSPPPGDYTVYVNAQAAGNGAATIGQLYTWVVDPSSGRQLAVTPQPVRGTGPGALYRYQAAWNGLDDTKRWLGIVKYRGSKDTTLVEID